MSTASRSLDVAIAGFGTVGRAVARLLGEGHHPSLRLAAVLTRRPDAARRDAPWLPPDVFWSDDIDALLARRSDVVVELIGGVEPARTWIASALRAGRAVVTANKQVVAEHGPGLFSLARSCGRPLRFEAAVGGAVPVIRGLQDGLAGDRVTSIAGVVDGTCNFVLGRMADAGVGLDDAVREAQALGFADRQPAAVRRGNMTFVQPAAFDAGGHWRSEMPKTVPPLRPATVALHGGQSPDRATGARAVPIYQTSSYVFESADHAAALFALQQPGHIYTRIGNPTTEVLERRLAELDGGVGALALASGQAAISTAVLTLAKPGDNIVSTRYLYGGTYNLFHYTLERLGIEARFVDTSDPRHVARAIDDRTRLLYTESIGNPRNNVDDFEALADTAHAAGVPFIVDNTVTPHIFRPFEHGADLAVYSLTKFIGGHGTSIGGAIVDSGRFNWANGRFAEFTEPDPSYHGLVFWDLFGTHERAVAPGAAFITKARVQWLRDFGACLSPFNAFLFLQGLETLPYRIAAHCANAARVASWLASHPEVAWVNYPGLPGHPDRARAERYLTRGAGAIVGFGIRGGLDAARRFIDSVRLFSHLANIGDAKSLVIHPASTTHQQLSPEERAAVGVPDDFIRLSIGIEDAEDLIADLDQAIAAATRQAEAA